jgi:hypothetical protein
MKLFFKILGISILVGICLNLVFPYLFIPFESNKDNLDKISKSDSFKTQYLSVLYIHRIYPFTSSLLVATGIYISVLVGKYLSKYI